jgi:hypothetical protein
LRPGSIALAADRFAPISVIEAVARATRADKKHQRRV